MAINEIHIDAPPGAVFDVLADPKSYEHWVVGSTKLRGVEGRWPEPGATFHHTQGIAGIGLSDTTTAIESERLRRLVLEVRIRPFMIGRVKLDLRPSDGGTHVTMVEYPIGGLARLLPKSLLDPALHLRNVESLRRLKRLAERHR